VLTRCGEEGLYNPLEEFCTSKEEIYYLCGGRQYDPPDVFCDEGDVIKGKCGEDESMNYDTHFCYGGESYALCGGKDYNPDRQFCSGSAIYDKCGGKDYNPSTEYCHTDGKTYSCGNKPYDPSAQFCSGTTIYEKCGGEQYNPSTQFCSGVTFYDKCGGTVAFNPLTEKCCGNIKYALATHFCYANSSKIGSFCGINPQKYYDPDVYECKPSLNPNGIYLKGGITDVREGKTYNYNAVLMGNQVWMAENLKYRPSDGRSRCTYADTSRGTTKAIDKSTEDEIAECAYGRRYEWVKAMNIDSSFIYANKFNAPEKHQGICPNGWHLPSGAELDALKTFAEPEGGLKLRANNGWCDYNGSSGNGTDNYGFAALNSSYSYSGGFYDPSTSTAYYTYVACSVNGSWLSTKEHATTSGYVFLLAVNNSSNSIINDASTNKNATFFVRCVKN